jgi:hypothetical protein
MFLPYTQGDRKGLDNLAGSCHGYGDPNGPSMPTRSFLAELLIAILTPYPALASSLILFSSSSPCVLNVTFKRAPQGARVNGWIISI